MAKLSKEYRHYLFVPAERIGTLIGNQGKLKRMIEKKTGVKLVIDSESGAVDIIRGEDPSGALKAENVVKAISLGFSPTKAMQLFYEDICFEEIDLSNLLRGKRLKRQKARLIGQHGKVKQRLEQLTNTSIAIDENVVALIGTANDLTVAKQGIELIIRGLPLPNVFKIVSKGG